MKGPIVNWHYGSMAWIKAGFDSRWVHNFLFFVKFQTEKENVMSGYNPLAEVGNVFFYLLQGKNPTQAHLIVKSEPGETPSGSECTDYTASCETLAFEYDFANDGNEPVFCKTIDEAVTKGAIPCEKCFPQGIA